MPDVFLSYSRVDTAFMQTTRNRLRAEGLDVWTDEGLESGSPEWEKAIEEAIRGSHALVLIASPDSKASRWVNRELTIAEREGVKPFVILHRGDDKTAIPMRVVDTNYTDARRQPTEAVNKISASVYKHVRSVVSLSPVKLASVPPPATTTKTFDYIVAKTGKADFRTINEALKVASEGAIIGVRPGLYRESLRLEKAVELIGDGRVDEIIIESGTDHCVEMATDYSVIRGITIRVRVQTKLYNSDEDDELPSIDGVVIENGRLILEDCEIITNSESAIYAVGQNVENNLQKCRVSGATWTGIVLEHGAHGLIEDCEFFNNKGLGILVLSKASPIVRKCRIHHNKGGAVEVFEAEGKFEDCDIFDNEGVGVEIGFGSTVNIQMCRIHGNLYAIRSHNEGKGFVEGCDLSGNVKGAYNPDTVFRLEFVYNASDLE